MNVRYGHLHAPPVMLTIAGSDSGGGAGIQADLKTFAALGTYGTSAITAITAQNPREVTDIHPVPAQTVAAQIRAVLGYYPVDGVKTGMLFSAEIIEAVADALQAHNAEAEKPLPLVVDPVMVSTSGAKLLNDDAIGALCERMFPLASVITPNLAEAALLAERTVESEDDLEPTAKALYDRYKVPVVLKGGHLKVDDEAVDVFWDGTNLEFFATQFLVAVNTHGTGCTYASATAVYLARGMAPADAAAMAKEYVHQTLSNALPIGPEQALNHAFSPLKMEMN